jgi:hypothetical protein
MRLCEAPFLQSGSCSQPRGEWVTEGPFLWLPPGVSHGETLGGDRRGVQGYFLRVVFFS